MGAKLSTQQKRVYLQVITILAGRNIKLIKRELKQLIMWLFTQFPQITPEMVHRIDFWNSVGTKLSQLDSEGESKSKKLVYWSFQIITALKEQGKLRKQLSPGSCSPCPQVLDPCSTSSVPQNKGILRETAHTGTVPGSCHPPGFPQGPPTPHLRSPGQTSGDSSPNPVSPTPKSPVVKPKAEFLVPEGDYSQTLSQNGSHGAQDGGGHMAFPSKTLSSSHNPFLFPSKPVVPSPPLQNPAHPCFAPPFVPPPSSTPFPPPPPLAPPPSYHPQAEHVPALDSAQAPSPTQVPTQCPSLPCSGSHAPPPGSHNPVPGVGAGLENRNTGLAPAITAAPVTYQQEGQGPVKAQWTPFPHSTIKELCKAQKEFSRESEYFRGLLRASLLETNVVPADLRTLFSCLLNPTEFGVWEEAWKKGIRDILPDLWADTQTSTIRGGEAVCTEHLIGTGNWADGVIQARDIPRAVLRESAKVAERAFLSLKTAVPSLTFSKIIQGSEEPFIIFVERLRRAIEQQVHSESARPSVLLEMAAANANTACKAAILSLPLDPPPTIQAMIEVCQTKVPVIVRQDTDTKPSTRRVSFAEPRNFFEAMPAQPQRTPTLPRPPPRGQCHLCGNTEHWMPDCPLRTEFYEFRRKQTASQEGFKKDQKN
ncbi:endogenous retrovirus group K member 24 Gag polyprotein-like [Passer domesticus]|uniref:endogenous retrovirus group K member 24 Gag polyprotein-like n=1 Tax=Passer domesticus TaxID=48849 RepID=UPI0030FE6FC4